MKVRVSSKPRNNSVEVRDCGQYSGGQCGTCNSGASEGGIKNPRSARGRGKLRRKAKPTSPLS